MKNRFLTFVLFFLAVSCSTPEWEMENTSMEGTISKGALVTIVSTDEILRNQVVAFDYHDKYMGDQTGVFRVAGIPGDTLKISQGQVFINGDLFQEPEDIKFSYQVIIDGKLNAKAIEGMEYQQINRTEYIFYLTRKEAERLRNNPVVMVLRILVRDYGVYQPDLFGSDTVNKWNIDNYGPIKIPEAGEHGAAENLYFLLGDNRHNAIDSRYIGYIPESKIRGLVKFP